MKRMLGRAIKWMVGGLLIGGIVWWNQAELPRIAQLFQDAHNLRNLLLNLGAACLIYLPCVLLTFYRWFWLVRAQELPFRRADALRLGLVGYVFSMFLPGSVSGDVIKAGLLAREQDRRTVAVATVIVDRLIGLLGLIVLVSLLGALFWFQPEIQDIPELRLIILFVWGITAVATLGIFMVPLLRLQAQPVVDQLLRIPKVGPVLAEVVRALQMYRHKARYLALGLALAVIGHVGFVLSFYFAARAVPGPTPSLEMHYLIIPVGMVIQAVPLTPGNLGVNEGVFEYLYRLLDTSGAGFKSKGMLSSLAQRLVAWTVALIGLGYYFRLRRTVQKVLTESQTELVLPSEEAA